MVFEFIKAFVGSQLGPFKSGLKSKFRFTCF